MGAAEGFRANGEAPGVEGLDSLYPGVCIQPYLKLRGLCRWRVWGVLLCGEEVVKGDEKSPSSFGTTHLQRYHLLSYQCYTGGNSCTHMFH